MVTQEFPPFRGGAATVCLEMARAATLLGWNVSVIAPGSPHGEAMDASLPFAVHRHGLAGKRGWRCRRRVRQTLESLLREIPSGTTTVHLADSAAVAAGMGCRPLLDSQHAICVTLHGSEIPLFHRWPWTRSRFLNLLERANRVHLLSHSNRRLLQQTFPSLETDLVVTGGAPSLPVEACRVSHPTVPDQRITVLTVGRIHPRKGQEVLARTLTRLPLQQQQRLRWRIVGPIISPPYRQRIEDVVRESAILTEFCGALSEEALVEAYTNADLFALTSIPLPQSIEGLGLVYLDAARAGLPILAHRTGGVEEVVLEGENGYLVNPEDDDLRLERLSALIDNLPERQRLGQRGKEWAGDQSWETVTRAAYGDING